MTFVEGRGFSREYTSDLKNYVINEETAKLMGFETTVGKMFSIWDNEGKVIGVVKNFHSRSLHNELAPVVFTIDPKWDWSLASIFVKIKPDDIAGTLDYIKSAAANFAPEYPFDYSFLNDHFDRQYRGDRQIGTIFNYFSYIAIFISCLGLFGLTTYMAGQRTKEIGIRKILGATKSYIVILLLKEFLLLVLIANIIAWPIAYLVMKKLMSSYVYHTDITIWLFFAASAITFLMTFLTISVRTFKAASSNPVNSLRYE
jgi:ABC-type antimicrobial peptide transport system permease subunit